jgi:hypothetical protein
MPEHGNYETEFFDATGKNGLWSLSVSSHDLRKGYYYVAVKGGTTRSFR